MCFGKNTRVFQNILLCSKKETWSWKAATTKLPYKKVNENEVKLEKIISGKVTVINYYREIIESYREVIEKLSIVIEKLSIVIERLLRSYRELSVSYNKRYILYTYFFLISCLWRIPSNDKSHWVGDEEGVKGCARNHTENC